MSSPPFYKQIQLQIVNSSYTQDSNGNRNFKIDIKFDTNVTEKTYNDSWVQKNPTAYLQLSTLDGTVTKLVEKNIIVKWKTVYRGTAIPPVGNEFSFSVSGNEALPNDIMRAQVYLWNDMKPVSYSISVQKTLESQALQATVPESASIGFTGITSNSVLVYWRPNKDGGSPIINYNLTVKNQDNNQTIIQRTLTNTELKIENLDSGTNYKVYVIVINAIGNSFEQSYGFKTLGSAPVIIPQVTLSAETISIIDKFDTGIYQIVENYPIDLLIESVKNGKMTNQNFIQTVKANLEYGQFIDTSIPEIIAPVEDSINTMMVSQSVGSFILKDGRLKGEILYIANTAFNPFYYGKNLASLVQIKSKSGVPIAVKPNVLNFTNTERDERIQIDEGVGNFKELIVDFFVWKSTTDLRQFSENKQIEVIETNGDGPECQIGYHKDFSGKCVPDDPPGEIPRDKLIDTLKGFLFGTVALSLLARKY